MLHIVIALHVTTLGVPLELGYFNHLFSQAGCDLSLLCMSHIKLAYFYLISHVIIRTSICNKKILNIYYSKKHCKRSTHVIQFMILAILLPNFLLIGICNPSLLNPGPRCLRVSYQNVQGLVPLSQLKNTHPCLDQTKIFELNAYIHKEKPDVLMLNETWLNKSIKNSEIIENQNYNVYRSDRSQLTHPADPSNPTKFKKSGGV